MKKHKFRIAIKWYKNDNGGDIRTICIDYKDEIDKKKQINEILTNFRTKPMDVGINKGKVPFSVTTQISSFKKF